MQWKKWMTQLRKMHKIRMISLFQAPVLDMERMRFNKDQ